ncbi:HEPN domain-containing protein [Thermoplasma sp.]|uniref:HEPN domain-containing protein n=1 Tax=Thermoplasma sp. TaxID=1973142 RepID=UPI00126AD423|nr:HEPN domain-containing protein [Thermoplasma sp.]KAA8922166.1 MAG: HEPN domain-containing protein [Thermoplasma sp.]
MSGYLDEDEFNRWLKNARYTLKSARADVNAGFYSWACFKAQQAAEFAVKAYLRGIGEDSFGHSVSLLLKKANFDESLINIAKKIDRYYIPTRYTDAWSDGSPEDYYSSDDAEEAISSAESIISEVENRWKSFRSA